jgi:hypothetical protein
MYQSYVTYVLEGGHMSGRNMCVYNILSYTYMYFLVLTTISEYRLHNSPPTPSQVNLVHAFSFTCIRSTLLVSSHAANVLQMNSFHLVFPSKAFRQPSYLPYIPHAQQKSFW